MNNFILKPNTKVYYPAMSDEIKNGKYIDILKVNSAGVIYLSLNKLSTDLG